MVARPAVLQVRPCCIVTPAATCPPRSFHQESESFNFCLLRRLKMGKCLKTSVARMHFYSELILKEWETWFGVGVFSP